MLIPEHVDVRGVRVSGIAPVGGISNKGTSVSRPPYSYNGKIRAVADYSIVSDVITII